MGRAKVTDKTLWRSGDWALTRTQGEAVRILEVLTYGEIRLPSVATAAGTVATAPAAELIPVSAAKVPSQPAIVYPLPPPDNGQLSSVGFVLSAAGRYSGAASAPTLCFGPGYGRRARALFIG